MPKPLPPSPDSINNGRPRRATGPRAALQS